MDLRIAKGSSMKMTLYPSIQSMLFLGLIVLFVGQLPVGDSSNVLQKRIRGGLKDHSPIQAKTNIGSVQAVYDLLDRVLKDPAAKDSIRLSIVNSEEKNPRLGTQKESPKDSKLWFRLEEQPTKGRSHSTLLNTRTTVNKDEKFVIAITATSASELTAGLGYYFKHYCNFTIEWSTGGRAGGSHIVIPDTWPVPLNEETPIVRSRTTKWSYLMNVCTHSYSLVWYDWTQWQSLIDNMALRGINMVLALTGQEEIQYKVFSKLGVKDQDIRSWFNGPAFLTWSRGQNEYGSGIAGPLPRSFMKSQWALQRDHILPRLRSLGMIGILPAFQGNVPIQLKALLNDTNITRQEETGWMNALDPMYGKIADLWMTQLIEDFGTDGYYQLDGWFNGGVPPWMNQNDLRQTKKQEAQNVATERRSMVGVDNNNNNNNNNKSFSSIPHDEGWYKRGQAAYTGLNRTDPDATWMYQGFAFVGWETPEQASYVKGFVDSVPEGKFIVIDMAYSLDGEWQKWENASFFGAPFIWSKLHNFGDTTGMRGDMEHINWAFPYQALEAQSSIVGIGGTPEGIDQNPIYYDFLYEQNFRPEPVKNLTSYLIKENHKRYGLQKTNPNVAMAWEYLLKSTYSQDFSVQDHTAVVHLDPDPSASLFRENRHTPKPLMCIMFDAWSHLLEAAQEMPQQTHPFLYDLVNVGREVLAQLSIPMALNFTDARSETTLNREKLTSTGRKYIELLVDIDKLVGSNVAFLLEPWLESARRLAREDVSGLEQKDCISPILGNQSDDGCCSCFYEFNARSQLTTWNPTPYNAEHVPGGPVDYAAKQWSGLISGYYAKRASILLKQALEDQQNGEQLNSTEVDRLFALHAYEWTTSVKGTNDSSLNNLQNEIQDSVQTSREMMEKYLDWFKIC